MTFSSLHFISIQCNYVYFVLYSNAYLELERKNNKKFTVQQFTYYQNVWVVLVIRENLSLFKHSK